MRVLFDYQAFEFQKIGGVSRSYAELIHHLKFSGCDCSISIKESDNVYLREKDLVPGIYPLNYHFNYYLGGKKLFKGQKTITRRIMQLFGYSDGGLHFNRDYTIKQLKCEKFDIFEPTFFDSYFLPYLKDKPFVLTVHDMIPELFPQYFSRDDFQIIQKRLLCPLAARIHVPSCKTKEDLVNLLDINPEKITVIPHGGPIIYNFDCIGQRLFDFPYLLYVGDRQGYKNFLPWLTLFKQVVSDNNEIHVVCTGRPFSDIEIRTINNLHLENNVVHFFASEDSFGSLYHNAIAFVYPSEYEGFGLPILEAFAYGCPVMLNDASCFPEVGGDAALYFNLREKSSDFYEKFNIMFSLSSEDRSKLVEKGKNRLQLFSWNKAAEQLMTIYNELI